MRRIVTQAANELRQLPGIRNVSAHIGRAITGDQVVNVESAQLWINIAPGADHAATLAAIRQTVQAYPGFDGDVQTYLTAKVKEVVPAQAEPIVVRVQGPERQVLRREAESVAKVLSRIPGLANPRVQHPVETPHVQVKVDLAAAAQVGLKPGDVRRAVATVFAGLEVGNLYEQQKVFEVVVWGTPKSRQDVTNIRELLIDTPDDGHVRLADVADVRVVPTPAVIKREGVSRGIDIRADIAGRGVGAVRANVKEQLQKIAFPLDYHAVLLGDHEARWDDARWGMLVAAMAAATGIYLLLQACFQSWRLASLLFVNVLAVPAGSIVATLAAGGAVSLGAVAACLAVVGIAVRQGIWLINRYQHLEREEGEVFGQGLVLRGTSERLGPILTSATAVGAAVLPLVAFGDTAGLEILHPMAVAILGGLVTSAIMNLFVIPALYLRLASPQPQMPPGHRSEQHA